MLMIVTAMIMLSLEGLFLVTSSLFFTAGDRGLCQEPDFHAKLRKY